MWDINGNRDESVFWIFYKVLNEELNKGFSDISSQLKTANAQLDNIAVNTALSAYYTEKTTQDTKRTALATEVTAWLIELILCFICSEVLFICFNENGMTIIFDEIKENAIIKPQRCYR